MVFEYNKLKQRTRLLVDEALNAVKAGFSDDEANLRPLELTQLEQRILMSASPMAAVAEAVDTTAPDVPVEDEFAAAVPVEQTDSDQTSVQQNDAVVQSTVELVVIDPSAENYEQLVADIQSQADREFEILILNPREDGIAQITDALQKLRDVSAIHLVSHGDEGEVLLGASVLSQRTIGRYAAELVTWQQSMTADADLLIYGCDLTASEDGIELTESLNALLGADIAASDDLTGHASLGGDWELETTVGTVESALAFTVNVQQQWSGLLSTGGAAVDGLIVSTSGAVNSPSGAPGLDSWDDSAALKFGGASLDLGSGTTAGSFSQQFDLSNFVDDGNADIDGLHYVSRDIMLGGAGGIQLLAGDILFSTEGTEDVNGGALRLRTEDVGLFRPDTAGDLTSGTVSILLEDLSIKTGAFLGPAVHGFTLIEQTTTVGDVTLQAGDFLYTNLNDFQADDIMLFETATVGDGNTSGTRSKLVNGVDLGFATSAFLFGIELIETETTIGGTTLSSGTILVQSSGNQTGIGSSNISSSAQDIIALELVTTEIGNGSSSGDASLFFRGSDVGLDSGAESIDAIALSLNHVPDLDIGGPYTISEGQDLSLDASGSSDEDGDALTYAWDLDNDGIYGETNEPVTLTSTVDWATLQSFGIDDDGVYTIGLQVNDGNGGIDTATATVTVNNSSPVLSTTGAATAGNGDVYTLNLSASDAGDDAITSWTINWGDGTIDTITGNPSTATHTYIGGTGHTYSILASATDEDGTWFQNELIAPSYTGNTVSRFAATTGDFVQKFATIQDTSAPIAAVIGPDGLLYISSEHSNDVLRYNAETGAFVDVFIAPATGGLAEAQGIAFGPDGHLYVADGIGSRIKRYDGTTGAFIDNFTTTGSGGLLSPYDLTFGPDGNLYVNSYVTGNVIRYNGTTGALIDEFVGPGTGGLSSPEGMAFGPDGNLYIASLDTDSVLRFNGTSGAFIDSFVSAGSGGLAQPSGLAFGPDGNLYVANFANGAIHRYNGSTGAYIDDYVTAGEGGFVAPALITFLPEQQVRIVSAPVITSDGGGATATVSTLETSAAVTVVTANDPQLPVSSLTYSLSGIDAARFTISSAGVLSFASPQDFETPTDANADNRYEVIVEVSNGIGSDTQAITVTVSDVADDVTGELWFTTGGNGDATGLSWTRSEVVQFGDSPDLFDTATGVTSGTFSRLPGFDAPANIRAMHYVESDLRFGSEPNHLDVVRGDLILVLDSATLNDTDGDPGNDISVGKDDIVVYRPDVVSDYSSGEYFLLLENGVRDPSNTSSSLDINAIALVERDTVVGGTTLTAGTFLVAHKNPGHEDIGTFTVTGTGANSSSSVVQTLLSGGSLGNPGTKVQGLHLLQQDTEFNGTQMAAGTLLVQVENSGTLAGTVHDEYDVVALTVAQTEQDSSPGSAATAVLLFDGSEVELGAGGESLMGFTVVSSSFPNPNSAPTVNVASDFTLNGINENQTDNGGTLVSELLESGGAGTVSDANGGAVGIAVTSVDDTNGTWEYSTDDGASWTAFGAVTQNSAVVLGAGSQDRVRFVPDLNFAGSESFTFHAWDGSDGITSGTTGVNASVTGGDTAFSVNTGTATVPIVSVNVVLNFATVGDVADSGGAPGLNSWTNSEIIVLGDPNFAFEPGTSGTLFKTYDLNDYTGGTDISIEAIHEVSTNITVGGVNGTVDLVEGDILFAALNNSVTYTGLDAVDVTAGKQDIVRFRPSDQTFALVFDEIGTPFVNGFTLIEKDVAVGDTNLSRGDVLLNIGNNKDILLVDVVGAGVGNTVGTASTLISGDDIGMGGGAVNIAGIDLIEEDISPGGFTLRAGQIVATLDGDDTDVGDNNTTVLASDVFLLDVTTTSLGPSNTTAATATVMLEGADLNLETNAELLTALSYTINFGVRNEPVLSFGGSPPLFTEGDSPVLIDATATVTDVDSANFDGGILRVELTGNGTLDDRISIRNQGTGANEIGLSGSDITFGGVLIGTFTGGDGTNPLVVSLNSSANEASVSVLLQNMTFSNVSSNPFTGDRTIRFSMTDGDGSSSQNYFKNVSVQGAATTTSTIIVDTTADVDDGDTSSIAALYADKGSDGKISLREAILAANATPNGGVPDRILFDIRDGLVGGAHTIYVTSALPDIDQQVIIDATTEGDYTGTPVIVLNGASAGTGAHGLKLVSGSDGTTIRGLAINQFGWDGIRINGSGSHSIVGNYLGTDAGGVADLGNGRDGIFLSSSDGNTIGGSSNSDRNVIIGNGRDGILLADSSSNVIQGNYVGLGADGVQNAGQDDDGIDLQGTSSANIIGGSATGEGNVIISSSNNGLELGGTSSNNQIKGNLIGVTPGGAVLGNATDGIRLHTNSNSNTIGGTGAGEGNVIANNARAGISTSGNAADSSSDLAIVGNSIYGNVTLAYDSHLNGVSTEDEMPILSAIQVDGSDLVVSGTINGDAGATYQLAFYANTGEDSTGYGEAERFLGTIDVTMDAGGAITSFNRTIAGAAANVGEFVTASARTSGKSTTEFSKNVLATAVNQAPTAAITPILTIRDGAELALDGAGSSDPDTDSLTYRWDLDNDSNFGESDEPTAASSTVSWATLQTFGITGPGSYTIGLEVDDGRGGTDTTTATLTIVPQLGAAASVVLSTAADTNDGGVGGADSWTRGSVVEFGDPNLSLTPASTSGTFSTVFNIDDFADDGDVDINGLHYVTANITVGGSDSIDLQVGDVLFSTHANESYNGGAVTSLDDDVLLFRPDTPGNYASGTFSKVLSGLSSVTGFMDSASAALDILAVTLVEKDTLIGDEIVHRGDFLYTRTEDGAGANDIYVFRTSGVGDGTTDGARELLIRGSDLGFNDRINGLEVVEEPITIGGQTLAAGELLITTNEPQSGVGDTSVSLDDSDIVRLNVVETTLNAGTASGTVTAFLTGGDVGLDSSAEEINALSLAGFEINSAPTATITGVGGIDEGGSLSLDATLSADPDGDSLNYEWDVAYDGTFTADFTTDTVDLTWSQLTALGIDDDGTYDIALRVNDGTDNSELEVVTLTVTNADPTISVTGNSEVGSGQTYTLDLNYSDIGNDTVQSWTVNWGDGTIDTYSGAQTAVTHVYTNGGFTNNITYSVTDDDGTHDTSKLVATSNGNSQVYFNDGGAESTMGIVSGPIDVVLGPDGLLYVSNFGSNDIDRLDPVTGSFVDTFAISNSGGLDSPSRMAFGPDGSLYITSHLTGEVLRYGNDGRFLGEFITGLSRPDGIAFDGNGSVYVSDRASGEIFKYDSITGVQIGSGPFATFGKGTFTDLNFGPNGNLFASNTTDNLIREFDSNGNAVGDFSGGPLTDVTSVAGFNWGPDGRLYVADFGGDRLAVYQADGTFVETFGTGLSNPVNLAFTSSLQVRVNDTPVAAGESFGVNEGGTLTTTGAGDWSSPGWKQRQQILLDNSASPDALSNVAVLVKLHASAADAVNIDYGSTRDGGEDLRFVDADGTLLKHEIETWDESGYSYVWVNVPSVDASSASDYIWMYYDQELAADGHSQNEVWNSDYSAVYHLNGNSLESTSNTNHGAIADVFVRSGIVGRAGEFNGSTSQINLGSDSTVDDIFSGGGTISAWINPDGSGENGYGRILDKASGTFGGGGNADGWAFQVAEVSGGDGFLLFEHGFSGGKGEWRTPVGSITEGAWQQVVLTYDSDSASANPRVYINGVLQTLTENKTPSGSARSDAALNLTLGNHSAATTRTFDGLIDEVRIARGEISADQIAAEYENVTGSFASASGTVETGPSGLLGNDADREGDSLSVSLVSGPTSAASFSLNSDGSFDYVHDGSETTDDSFTYTVNDGTTTSAPVTVSLTITPQNDAPVVSAIGSQSSPEDATIGPLAFTVSDAETAGEALTVTATSDNQALIADSGIVLGGAGANRTITLTPVANATGGPATITVNVSDGVTTTQMTFQVTLTATNDAPTITPIGGTTTPEDTAVGPIAFTVQDAESAAGALTVSAFSSDQSLVRDADIVISGTGANRTISFVPVANAVGGPATITVRVSDGVESSSSTFDVTVTSSNDPPEISAISDVTVDEDTDAGPIRFTVSDVDSPVGDLTITATSSDQSLVTDSDITLLGNGTNRRIRLSPQPNVSGTTTITLAVSDGGAQTFQTFDVTFDAVDDAPTIGLIPDITTAEDTSSSTVSFVIGDIDSAAAAMSISAVSVNQSIVADGDIVLGGSGPNRTIRFTPAANASGEVEIVVTLSDGTTSVDRVFKAVVTPVNDLPTISSIASQTIDEDTPSASLPFTIGDVETSAGALTVTATSDNQSIIADGDIVISGTGANRSVQFTPVKDAHGGPVRITLAVSDGTATTTEFFDVMVNAVNDRPQIDPIANVVTLEDTVTGTFAFGIGDAETDAGSLVVSAVSSDQSLVADSGITLGGTEEDRTISISPVANANGGPATITVSVSDGVNVSTETFRIRVTPVNDAPAISAIPNVTTPEDTAVGPYSFTISDVENTAGTLIVTATSDDQSLVRDSDIILGGTGANRTISLTPAPNANGGPATITVRVFDGTTATTETFEVTVNPINDAPTVATIPNVTIDEDTTAGPYTFVIGDVDDDEAALTVTATSSNQGLIADSGIVLSGAGASRTITVTPLANVSGTATITVVVSDGRASVLSTFDVTVTSVNDAPEIEAIPDVTTAEDTPIGPYTFTIGDVETASADLILTATSSDQDIVADSAITLGGTAGNRTISISPSRNAFGTVTITLTVSDGATTTLQTFDLTVTAVNDAPVISAIADMTIDEDAVTGPLAFTVRDIDDLNRTLTVTATSSNPDLIADGDISFTGKGANRNLIFKPVKDQFGGPVTISLVVSDGESETTTDFVVNIRPINDAPEFAPGTKHRYFVDDDFTLELSDPVLLDGVTDVENDQVTVVLVTGPAHGELTLKEDGSFAYVAEVGYQGIDFFEFSVTDGKANSRTQRVSLILPVTIPLPIATNAAGPTSLLESDTVSDSSEGENSESVSEETEMPEEVAQPDPESLPVAVKPDDAGSMDDDELIAPPMVQDDEEDAPAIYNPVRVNDDNGSETVSSGGSIDVADADRVLANALSFEAMAAGNAETLGVGIQTGDSVFFTSVNYESFSEVKGAVDQIEHLKETLDSQIDLSGVAVNTVAATGTAVVVSAVVTAIRTGVLALGFLTQLPIWTMFDPLMVMDGASGEEGDSLQEIVDRNAREAEKNKTQNNSKNG